MGELAPIISVASAGVGLAGSISQSRAISAQGAYQQQQYNLNASMANLQAQNAAVRGAREYQAQNLKVRRLIGAQRAASAGQGVDVNSGSALGIQSQTRAMGALDAMTIQNNAYLEALGYKMQSASDIGQGRMARLAAQNKSNDTLLTGGLNAAREIGYGAYQYDRLRVPVEPNYDGTAGSGGWDTGE